MGRAYFLFYTTDPQAPELFSDYQEPGAVPGPAGQGLRSYRRRKAVLWSLLGILFLAALFLGHSYDVQPDHFVRLPLILLYAFDPILLLFLAGMFFYSLPHRPPGPQDPVRHLQRPEGRASAAPVAGSQQADRPGKYHRAGASSGSGAAGPVPPIWGW